MTNSLSAAVLCQICRESIKRVYETGAIVHGSVFDSAPKIVGMTDKLSYQNDKLDGSFPHTKFMFV